MKNFSVLGFGCLVLLITLLSSQEVSSQDVEDEDDDEAEELDVGQNNQTISTGNGTISNVTMNRVMSQINNIFTNVNQLNITGIVDQALGFQNDTTVRNYVNNIMRTIFCNAFLANYNNCGFTKKGIKIDDKLPDESAISGSNNVESSAQ